MSRIRNTACRRLDPRAQGLPFLASLPISVQPGIRTRVILIRVSIAERWIDLQMENKFKVWSKSALLKDSVVVPDPYVFGPPGSGSIIICMDPDLDPDPSIIKQKY